MTDFQHLIKRELYDQNDDGSHVETDPWTWHPSQLAKCPRQAAISKCGLEEHDSSTLGRFKLGTMIHEWIEESLGEYGGIDFEVRREKVYDNGLKITGRCDALDRYEGAIYDFKTRSSWYKHNPPVERHMKQLALYLDMFGYDQGQIVYISKKDMEVRTHPEDGFYTPDDEVVGDIIDQAVEMSEILETIGMPESKDDLPWDSCGCWICENEDEEGE